MREDSHDTNCVLCVFMINDFDLQWCDNLGHKGTKISTKRICNNIFAMNFKSFLNINKRIIDFCILHFPFDTISAFITHFTIALQP